MNVTGLFLGRVEIAEEAKESIKREFLKELNVDIAINRLVWIAENFFEYNGKDIHELGLYFSVSSNHHPYAINSTPFYGMEGERLMYKWTPIEEIGNVELYPEFLRAEIKHLPKCTSILFQWNKGFQEMINNPTDWCIVIAPEGVREDKIFNPHSSEPDWEDPNLDFSKHSETGVIGDPTYVSAELGEKLRSGTVDAVSGTLQEIAAGLKH